MKAVAILTKTGINSPFSDLTLLILLIKKKSKGCLILDTAPENKSFVALLLFLIS